MDGEKERDDNVIGRVEACEAAEPLPSVLLAFGREDKDGGDMQDGAPVQKCSAIAFL